MSNDMKLCSIKEICEINKIISPSELVDVFFRGSVTNAAKNFNVSRQTFHNWMNDDDLTVEVLYSDAIKDQVCFDFILHKQVARVGAIHKMFAEPVGYVYAISNGSITKIGSSKNPNERVKVVAREIGLTDYKVFISNPTHNYAEAEKNTHKSLEHLKRENTIYQREVFSCDIETARSAINKNITGISTGLRKTKDYAFNKIVESIKGKEQEIIKQQIGGE